MTPRVRGAPTGGAPDGCHGDAFPRPRVVGAPVIRRRPAEQRYLDLNLRSRSVP